MAAVVVLFFTSLHTKPVFKLPSIMKTQCITNFLFVEIGTLVLYRE